MSGPLREAGAAAGEGFPAGGEMEGAIGGFDWSQTPLGPADGWSAALRMMVRILLANRFPLLLWWGPEYTCIYNDAYRPILGTKHPGALGQPVSRVWREIWPVLKPLIDTPFGGGPATWDDDILLEVNRHGFVEETHFTIAYSAVPDETAPGGIGGVLATVHEITGKVVADRRVSVLRDLGAQSADAKTAEEACAVAVRTLAAHAKDVPFAMLYLADRDGKAAQLTAVAGVAPGEESGTVIALEGGEAADRRWPLAEVMRTEAPQAVTGLAARLGGQVPAGLWDDPPHTAVVVPVASNKAGVLAGFLVAGISPRLALDGSYLDFLNLAAAQVAMSIANAREHEREKERTDALAELDRAKTTFFSNLSHEFRTPLTLIMGPVAELQRRLAGADPQVREELEIISRNGLRLGKLVNTLLDFSRIEAGRMQASYEPADLAAVTAELASVFRSAAGRAGLALEVDCPPLPEPVWLDRGMWEKVVLNLLSNALKFTFDGSIRVAVRAQGGQAVLTVTDTGTGVPARELPRLFERFHRIENARARSNEGSGIGLALVSELIGLHGGTITAASTEGQGTTFTVRLPFGHAHLPEEALVPADHAATVSATAEPFVTEALRWMPGTGPDGDGGPGALPVPPEIMPRGAADPAEDTGRVLDARVLVADDNADMREYLARLLRTVGYQVTAVTDGQAALDAARSGLPDLVLTDVMMPGLDGLGLVEALRADPRTAPVPVVVLSARAGEEAAAAGLQAGADDYLPKPFSAADLLARVRSNLDMARFRNRESQFRRALIESLQEGFFVTDDQGTLLEANQAFLALVGYDPGGLPFTWPHPWIPAPQADPDGRALMDQAFASYQARGGGRYTVPARHRDGHTVWLACSAASLPSRDGRARLIVGTARDVTSERLAAQREATLAGFAAALAAAGEVSEMLATAARQIAAALHASQVTVALWSSSGTAAITGWPPQPPGAEPGPAVAGALAAARHAPAASAAVLPGQDGDTLLAAPLDGAGTSAVAAGFPSARTVRAEERDLFAVLASHLAQVLAKARDYAQARTVALTLQQAILGATRLPHGFAVRYVPAVAPLEVGGDWYDVVPVPGQKIGVLVGDCVGRGLAAAAVMGQLRSAGQAVLLRASSPAEALTDLDTFAARIPAAECTSVFCAIIDPAAATITYSSAGHPPPILAAPGGGWSLLDQAQSLPLAIPPAGAPRKQATAALLPGATLMLYTDGLVERRRIPLDDGISAAAALLTAHDAQHPDTIADQITSGMTPPAGFEDDVAVLIYRHPPGPLTIRASADDQSCLAAIRARLRQWLPQAGIGADQGTDILIAIGEAAANAYEHGTIGRGNKQEPVQLTVTARLDQATVQATIADTGTWRTPAQDPGTRGHGIAFMHALMDEVTISTTGHGTTVTMTKEL